MSDSHFVDPRTVPFAAPQYRGELPHLYKPGCTYFITFRLRDAVIQRPGRPIPSDLNLFDVDPARLVEQFDPPLDLGACILNRSDTALIVQEALLARRDLDYQLAAWCIMPNHVHLVFTPLNGMPPSKILQQWKGGSAFRINKLLQKQGPVWERESFDHLVRSEKSLDRFMAYTENNPVQAGLCKHRSQWQFSSAYAPNQPS